MKKQIQKITTLLFVLLPLVACSRKELDKDNDSVDKAQTYHLLEKRQRVIRYNCQNQVTSDKIESVKTPIEHLSIKPQAGLLPYSSSFYNATLGTYAGSIVNHTDFTIDLNPGTLNMQVLIGINQINYKFYECAQLLPAPNEGQCAVAPELRESGSLFINVSYENIDLPGETLIKPSAEQCSQASAH